MPDIAALAAEAHALRLEALHLNNRAFEIEQQVRQLQATALGTERAPGDEC